ncbi:MAG: ATP-binding cassette domain-containing protein [Coriobacteriia bacterium]|nr:ATP-binding cassette domain-containing protein [Coriobacteriia bacterium]
MPTPAPATPLLAVRSLTVTRPGDGAPATVLHGVDLTVSGGALTDIVGPSGSGKTTLLLALARLLPGVEGQLSLAGRPATGISPEVWRSRVAYLPQRSALIPGSVHHNLTLPWRLKVRAGEQPPADADLRAALDRVHLADVGLDREADRLSEGQAARIALLRCILTRPDVLLLDEPDASLDDESAAQVAALTREFVDGGGAVIRVRHLRADGTADRRLRLAGGSLAEERT